MNRINYVVLAVLFITILSAGCSDKKEEAKAWNENGSALIEEGKYSTALKALDKATELDPQNATYWNNKGIALANLRSARYEKALQAYDKAIELNPQYASAWNNKGTTLAHLGKYEEAIQAYDKAIELEPQNANVWVSKGSALYELGRYEEAIQAYDKAIELEPQKIDAWYKKSNTLYKLGRYEEAVKSYDKAFELDPKNTNALQNKITSYDDFAESFSSEVDSYLNVLAEHENDEDYGNLTIKGKAIIVGIDPGIKTKPIATTNLDPSIETKEIVRKSEGTIVDRIEANNVDIEKGAISKRNLDLLEQNNFPLASNPDEVNTIIGLKYYYTYYGIYEDGPAAYTIDCRIIIIDKNANRIIGVHTLEGPRPPTWIAPHSGDYAGVTGSYPSVAFYIGGLPRS